MKSFFYLLLALFVYQCDAAEQRSSNCLLLRTSNNDLDLLFHTIEQGQLKKVKKLMKEKQIEPDEFSPNKRMTPLGFAAKVGHVRIFAYLIKKSKAPDQAINEVDAEELSALGIAQKFGHTEIVCLLRKKSPKK